MRSPQLERHRAGAAKEIVYYIESPAEHTRFTRFRRHRGIPKINTDTNSETRVTPQAGASL
jgi:hypothetical protein